MSDSTPRTTNDTSSTAKRELPRLRFIHLLMWLAVTAVAFTFARVRSLGADQSETATNVTQPAVAQMMIFANGVCYGTFLFIAIAVIAWSLRGYYVRLAPGHVLAFEGAAQWLTAGTTLILAILSEGDRAVSPVVRLTMWLPLAISVVFFGWYSCRRGQTAVWRSTFAVLALTPLVTLPVAWVLILSPSFWYVDATACVVRASALTLGLMSDRLRGTPRHWSHWAAGGAAVMGATAQIIFYGWCIIHLR